MELFFRRDGDSKPVTLSTLAERSLCTLVALVGVLLLASCRSAPARAPETSSPRAETPPAPPNPSDASVAAAATGARRDGPAPTEVPVDRQTIAAAAAAANRFAFDLYSRLRSRPGDEQAQNFILSPLSAEIALAMTATGARGTTRTQMEHVLRLNEIADPHHAFGELMASLNHRNGLDGMQLHTADRLWGQSGLRFDADFVRSVADHYGAPVGFVDFAHDRDAARTAINDWAAAETNQRIKDLLLPGDMVPAPTIVLADAVYFKGAWQSPFYVRLTRPDRFVAPAGVVEADMMWQRKWLPYAHVDGLQAVELPYRGGLSMLIVLPDAADGLSEAERGIAESYGRLRSALQTREVDLKIPRWKTTSRVHLEPQLVDMGMPNAFGDADFSGIVPNAGISLSFVIQKAFAKIDEHGTQAAAVTAVGATTLSGEGTSTLQVTFHADHPFLYLIRDPAADLVLFVGRVVDPRP